MAKLVFRKPELKTLQLVEALSGRWHGYAALCRCPAHADSNPSLSIRQGDRGLLVNCFAGCDPVDVLRALRRVMLGSPQQILPAPHAAGKGRPDWLWNQASPVEGTIAQTYLRHRHLRSTLPRLRFHPHCPFGRKPDTRFVPALLVGICTDDVLRAVQRVELAADGRSIRKAILGSPGNASWCYAIHGTTLAIAEGFETAAAYTELRGIPCWASLGANRLPLLSLPTTITRLIIASDNDAEGRRAACRAAIAHARPGLQVFEDCPPTPGLDWADVLAARAERGEGRGG